MIPCRLESAKRYGQMLRAEEFWCLQYGKRLVRKKSRERLVNDVDACSDSLHHATRSWFSMHNNPSLLLTLSHGPIERLDVLRVMAFECYSLSPHRPNPLCTHFPSNLSCDPLPFLVLLRHFRHRKSYNTHASQPSVDRIHSTLSAMNLRPSVCPPVLPATMFTYSEVNSASTYPPFPNPSIPTCTESGDIGL